jgi:phenylalanyl-tRNA synthetase alpha chain
MDLSGLEEQISADLRLIKTVGDCASFHQKYLAKTGGVTRLMQNLRESAPEKRAQIGAALNDLKKNTERKLFSLQSEIKDREYKEKLLRDNLIDITIPEINGLKGTLHPITLISREVEEVFAGMGFIIEDGPEIATEYENFESLNISKDHPARDMQDTFWLDDGRVLRAQTSAWQNHMLRTHGPSFKAICPGRTFRNESIDASHETTFFQVEGMMVGEDISIANLIYFMKEALTAVFKKDIKIRLRPGYFPFVEPGFELDASCVFCDGEGCPICKHSTWVEFCGCGMIHPKVLREGGIDPEKYRGFAFGFGLTRLAMLRYGISEIRLFNSGNLDFLKGIPQ